MTGVRYEEVRTVTALNRVHGMGFKWSFNPYQGCAHGCHYCFARRYHYLRDQDAGNGFSNTISVKVNAPEALHHDLSRPSWRYEPVAVGTATDPYQPIEGKYRLTRRCLQVFCTKQNPISLVTKGTMVVRDQDLLLELTRQAGCTICFSITTMDVGLSSRLEPGTPPPIKRLQAVEKLVNAGVNVGVLLAPVIPGITDSSENLQEVVRASAAHGARFLGASTLYLKEGTKEHFLSFLAQDYPRLVQPYKELYPGAFAPWHVKESVNTRVAELTDAHGLRRRPEDMVSPARPQQLQLAF